MISMKPSRYIFLISALIAAMSVSAAPTDEVSLYPSTRPDAEKTLASRALDPAEGLWEDPASETLFLVLADPARKRHYDVVLIESVDCRLTPGTVMGSLSPTPDLAKYRLTLYSRLRKGLLDMPRECAATLKGDAMLIESPGLKISLNASVVLPKLWNTLRVPLRVRSESPASELPAGWIKIYPSYDLNGSRRGIPRAL